ncbi:MAG: DUF4864 domain-containing protein [Pseudomonadota bacterium]
MKRVGALCRQMIALWRAAAVALAIVLSASASAHAQSDESSAAAQQVIASQLEAFSRDDWSEAFTFASPNIKRIFGTPERFGQMVRNGYPMVWRPSRTEFVEVLGEAPRIIQRVLLTDGDGRIWIAQYAMLQLQDGSWKIDGVQIEEQAGA